MRTVYSCFLSTDEEAAASKRMEELGERISGI